MSDYSHRSRSRGPARVHRRIVRRMQPGRSGRRKSKVEIRLHCQRATAGAVRQARKSAGR